MIDGITVKETIEKRKSVRTYDSRNLGLEDREKLLTYADTIENPFKIPTRIGLVDLGESSEPRKLGTYGVIKGASAFLGIVVPQKPLSLETAGYAMEKLILYATQLSLGTCWLAGTLNREAFTKALKTGKDEWMPAITPVGYPAQNPSFHEKVMRNTMKASQRKGWEELFFHGSFDKPLTRVTAGEYAEILDLLRLAPSATNAQPWRLLFKDGQIHFFAVMGKDAKEENPPAVQRVDLGIAACHFHLAALENKRSGHFEALNWNGAPEGWKYEFSWLED